MSDDLPHRGHRAGLLGVATTDALDRLLWTQTALSFLPHCRMDSALAADTPIWIDETAEHNGPCAVLVNLNADPPPFFSRFERLAEIVGKDESDIAAARERFRFYRERGYDLRTHNLEEIAAKSKPDTFEFGVTGY